MTPKFRIALIALGATVSPVAMAQSNQTAPAAAASAPAPATQDQTAASDQQADAQDKIGDIVVTARRREERLQNVPIAVSAVSGNNLQSAGIQDTRDLTQVMPALVFTKINANFQPYIRGVGTRNGNAGDESNVSVYIDGIYQPIMASLGFDLLSIERVEVLRGPQGTLFGRNATGGLINIITKDPSFTRSGDFKLEGGNFGQRSARFYGTTGLSSTLAVDVSALYKADDGYIRDLVRGGHVGNYNSQSVRGRILWQPSDDFHAILSASASHQLDGSSLNNQPYKGNSIGLKTPLPAVIADKPWESALDKVLVGTSDQTSVNLQMQYKLPTFTIESNSSYQKNFSESQTDNDGTTKPVSGAVSPITSHYFTQELRILSSLNGPFNYTAGVYYFTGKASFDPLDSYSNGLLTLGVFSDQNVNSYAGFGEGTYDITKALQFTLGARYTWEDRDFTSVQYNGTGVVTGTIPLQKASFGKLTYRAALLYKIDNSTNAYASYSRGFKSGVFNGFATSLAAAKPTRPETLDAFEVGIKSDPTNWLRVNLSAFYYDYKDQQQSARDPSTSLVILFNAARSKMKGAELEVTAVPIDNLTLRFTGSYLDAKYDSFPNAQVFVPTGAGGNNTISDFDASGYQMIRAPKYSLSTNFSYVIPTSAGDFGISGNVYHSAKYYWEFSNRLTQPAYTLVNGELSWSPSKDLRLSIWGRNLTNEVVYRQMVSDARGDVVAFDPPREFGGTVSVKF